MRTNRERHSEDALGRSVELATLASCPTLPALSRSLLLADFLASACLKTRIGAFASVAGP